MKENKEISALIHLIDDPDEEVYNTVSNKIISFGKDIIPNLEHLWENVANEQIQERIELLIHHVHYKDLTSEFAKWASAENPDLLQGALLLTKYHYPDSDDTIVFQKIEKIRRNIWLELNSYLTPLEQINVITSILYNYYKHTGVEFAYNNPDEYLINKTLDNKRGNAISNGIIYLTLCQLLDIPIKAINIPRQFILAYFDTPYHLLNPAEHLPNKIKFYIDPLNGQVYSHKDVESYFKRIAVFPTPSYFRQLNNKQIIQLLIEELSKCFDDDKNRYKMSELLALGNLLEPY